jgi:hypothetical protein
LEGCGKEGDEEHPNCIPNIEWGRSSSPNLPRDLLPGDHRTDTQHAMTYASVVLRESVQIALTLAALNDLDVKMAYIENGYPTARITETIWTVLGLEFGDDAGKRALVVRSLYDLKSVGSA